MGDRCYVTAHVRAKDRDAFVKIVGEPNQELVGTNLIEMEFEDANYGLFDELDDAARAELLFVAYNGAGDNYSTGSYACNGEESIHVETSRDGDPVVSVPIDDDQLKRAETYLRIRDAVIE